MRERIVSEESIAVICGILGGTIILLGLLGIFDRKDKDE
jgi:hypothetical protein